MRMKNGVQVPLSRIPMLRAKTWNSILSQLRKEVKWQVVPTVVVPTEIVPTKHVPTIVVPTELVTY